MYYEKQKELGIDVEEAKKERKEKKILNKSFKEDIAAAKQVNFLLLPANNLIEGEEPLPALSCQSFKTSEKHDVKYLKRFLAQKLNTSYEDLDLYCYNHRLNDNRDLAFVFKMLWKNHKLTAMKPEGEANILVMHYCKKGTYRDKDT